MRFEEIREKIVNNPGFRTLREIKSAGYRIVKERDGDRYFLVKPEELRPLLVRLGDVAEVRRGFTTGANEFFYLEPVELTVAEVMKLSERDPKALVRVKNGAGWEGEIEAEFLKPVIKSPRECRTILVKPEDLRYLVFMCRKSKKELQGTKALEYIEWGENVWVEIKQGSQKGKKIRGFHRLATLKGRKQWWDLGNQKLPKAVWQKSVDTRHIQSGILFDAFVDQRLYLISSSYSAIALGIVLNSILFFLSKEIFGRVNLGEGALDTTVDEAKQILILSPLIFQKNVSNFKTISASDRPIQSIFTECGIDPESGVPISEQEPKPLPDRKALDDLVFDVLGLTDEERKEVYRAVCQLVWERISKARSVRRR